MKTEEIYRNINYKITKRSKISYYLLSDGEKKPDHGVYYCWNYYARTSWGHFFLTKYTATKDLETEIPSQLPIASISSFTQSCIERIAKEAVAQNGVQGGYFEPPPEYVEVANLKIPYFYDGKNDAT